MNVYFKNLMRSDISVILYNALKDAKDTSSEIIEKYTVKSIKNDR